jgi:hypothetical protein
MNPDEQQAYDLFVSSMQEVFFPFTDVEQPDIERAAAVIIERLRALFDGDPINQSKDATND